MANLQNLKPFKKGNPGGPGRPKLSDEQKTAKKMARELAQQAMQRLEHWMKSDKPQASIAASMAIIDRAEGKPKQEIEHSGQTTQYVISDAPAEVTTDAWLSKHIRPDRTLQ